MGKNALASERDLLIAINKMSPSEVDALINESRAYGEHLRQQALKIKEEETTKRKQIELEGRKIHESHETERKKFAMDSSKEELKARNEELKKLEEKKTEEEKKRVDYRLKREQDTLAERTRIKLEAKEAFEKLKEQNLERDFKHKEKVHELEEAQRMKELEREKMLVSHKLKRKSDLEVELADFHHQQAVREHEVTKEYRLEHDLAVERLKQQGMIDRERYKWDTLTNFFTGREGRKRMMNILGFTAGCIAVFYTGKVVAPLAAKALHNRFFKPQLAKSVTLNSPARALLKSYLPYQKKVDVVFKPKLEERLHRIIEGTKNTAARRGFFGHILLYGSPGTGKTLYAEKLAQEANMDFALMSGPSFDQFTSAEAIVEIKELFKWANSRPRGAILFIDEADTFLEDRSTLSPDRVRVLNEFINQTGTESKKFMLVFETNRPWVLDPAVQSRITQAIEFEPPTVQEITEIFKLYAEKYIRNERGKRSLFGAQKSLDHSALTDAKIEEYSVLLAEHGFVGRDISNLIITLVQSAYADPEFAITEENLDRIIHEQMEKKKMEKGFAKKRKSILEQTIDKEKKFFEFQEAQQQQQQLMKE